MERNPIAKRSGPKPKNTNPKNSSPRIERKRVQNRISQQCVRERNLAHAVQLESLIETIKASNNANSGDEIPGANKVPLSSYLKLVEENEMLKDALLRVRKKMLSLTHITKTTADDEIFDYILNGRKPTHTGESNVVTQLSRQETESGEQWLDNFAEGAKPLPTPLDSSEESTSSGSPLDMQKKEDTLADDTTHSLVTQTNLVAAKNVVMNTGVTENVSSVAISGPISEGLSVSDLFDLSVQQFSSPHLTANSISKFSHGDNHGNFTPDTVLEACKTYLSQIAHQQSLNTYGPEFQRTVSDVSVVAVTLLASLSGLESAIYGMGAADFLSKIVRWRLSPTPENILAVPEPYKPTPLQCSTPNHPLTIDLLAWPSLRDQVLLHAHECDIDLIMKDIILNTVFEVHHQKIAVNVLDFYQHKCQVHDHEPYRLPNSNGDVPDPTWKYAAVGPARAGPTTGFTLYDPDMTAREVLLREIYWRMPFSSISQFQKNDLVTRYGLDRRSMWKLSKGFSQRNPMFDCSLVTTPYTLVLCSAIPGL